MKHSSLKCPICAYTLPQAAARMDVEYNRCHPTSIFLYEMLRNVRGKQQARASSGRLRQLLYLCVLLLAGPTKAGPGLSGSAEDLASALQR